MCPLWYLQIQAGVIASNVITNVWLRLLIFSSCINSVTVLNKVWLTWHSFTGYHIQQVKPLTLEDSSNECEICYWGFFFLSFFLFFYWDLFCQRSSRFTPKLRFPLCPLSLHVQSLLIISIPHQNYKFVTINEPTSTHHTLPKSIVYITVHSWYLIFY